MKVGLKCRRVVWLIEQPCPEVELAKTVAAELEGVSVDVISIKYWLSIVDLSEYDVVVIPFLPTGPSAHYSLIEGVLALGVTVVVLNWWQSFSSWELAYRENSLAVFKNKSLYLCSWRKAYTQYLESLNYGSKTINCEFHMQALIKARGARSDIRWSDSASRREQSKAFFLINAGLAFMSEELKGYRLKTGANQADLEKQIRSDYLSLTNFFQEISKFSLRNPTSNVVISAFPSVDSDKFVNELEQVTGKLRANMFVGDTRDLMDNILSCDVLITNVNDLVSDVALMNKESILYHPTPGSVRGEGSSASEERVVTDLNFPVDQGGGAISESESLPQEQSTESMLLAKHLEVIVSQASKSTRRSASAPCLFKFRCRIAIYNCKQHVLRLLGFCKQREFHSLAGDHFLPFRVKDRM